MFNPMQIFQFMQQGVNPQQMFSKLMQDNPEMAKLINGVNFNDIHSVENMCRNICIQKGLDYDTMLAQFKQQSGGKFR